MILIFVYKVIISLNDEMKIYHVDKINSKMKQTKLKLNTQVVKCITKDFHLNC